jgi:predicted DNA-binding ribbon-helix-helix protein
MLAADFKQGICPMKSPVIKHSIVIRGHKTSVSLEEPFWTALKEIAVQREMTLSDVVTEIDDSRDYGNLSSAIRLFVLGVFQSEVTQLARPQPKPCWR